MPSEVKTVQAVWGSFLGLVFSAVALSCRISSFSCFSRDMGFFLAAFLGLAVFFALDDVEAAGPSSSTTSAARVH